MFVFSLCDETARAPPPIAPDAIDAAKREAALATAKLADVANIMAPVLASVRSVRSVDSRSAQRSPSSLRARAVLAERSVCNRGAAELDVQG